MKRLIINADDCNLTAGVTRGILLAHDRGIVTGTTLMMNLPLTEKTVKELKKRKTLGLGVHLNVTFGKPLTKPSQVSSLLKSGGIFRRPDGYQKKTPQVKDVIREYDAQIKFFENRFENKPDHLDTHHHLHDRPVFFKALVSVARKWKLPVRRCRFFQKGSDPGSDPFCFSGLKTTDYLYGNLATKFLWGPVSFWGVVENLPEGTSEIACHPGFYDTDLARASSLCRMREVELKLFSDGKSRKKLAGLGIELVQFSQI